MPTIHSEDAVLYAFKIEAGRPWYLLLRRAGGAAAAGTWETLAAVPRARGGARPHGDDLARPAGPVGPRPDRDLVRPGQGRDPPAARVRRSRPRRDRAVARARHVALVQREGGAERAPLRAAARVARRG